MARKTTIPRRWALLFSVVAVLLAIGPGVEAVLRDNPVPPYSPEIGVLTATLIAIIWYATFTFESLQHSRRLERIRRRRKEDQVVAICQLIQKRLRQLPTDERRGQMIREVSPWSDEHVKDLIRGGAFLGREPRRLAVQAASELEFLSSKIRDVQSTSRQAGYHWRDFPWDRWRNAVDTAESKLKELKRLASLLQEAREFAGVADEDERGVRRVPKAREENGAG